MKLTPETEYILPKLFSAKTYHQDMAHDMKEIIMGNMDKYGGRADSFEMQRAADYLKNLLPIIEPVSSQNRIYVVNGIQNVTLCCVDLSELQLKKLCTYFNSVIEREPPQTEGVDENLISTLFIFQNERLSYRFDIYPSEHGMLLNTLSKQNVIVELPLEQWNFTEELLQK